MSPRIEIVVEGVGETQFLWECCFLGEAGGWRGSFFGGKGIMGWDMA